ncbi:MAG: glycosyltransferase family 4 protein [Balneolaceae bacterium]
MQRAFDCEIDEFSPSKALLSRYDILHMHWPDVMLSQDSLARSFVTVVGFLLIVMWMKLKGTRIVWTIHNLVSHDFTEDEKKSNNWLEKWYMNRFTDVLDGVIGLSKVSLDKARIYYPTLSGKAEFVIPHGHYKGVYPDKTDKKQARKYLDIPLESFLLTYFGQIRPYKNVPELIKVFSELAEESYCLLIAGKPLNKKYRDEIQDLAAKSSNQRIKLLLEFIPENEIQYILRASDLIVIPYEKVLNSGTVLLSLSYDVPVLVPNQGSIVELQQVFGVRWVQTYSANLSHEKLQKAIERAKNYGKEVCEPIREFGWDKIVNQTMDAYQEIINS